MVPRTDPTHAQGLGSGCLGQQGLVELALRNSLVQVALMRHCLGNLICGEVIDVKRMGNHTACTQRGPNLVVAASDDAKHLGAHEA